MTNSKKLSQFRKKKDSILEDIQKDIIIPKSQRIQNIQNLVS